MTVPYIMSLWHSNLSFQQDTALGFTFRLSVLFFFSLHLKQGAQFTFTLHFSAILNILKVPFHPYWILSPTYGANLQKLIRKWKISQLGGDGKYWEINGKLACKGFWGGIKGNRTLSHSCNLCNVEIFGCGYGDAEN